MVLLICITSQLPLGDVGRQERMFIPKALVFLYVPVLYAFYISFSIWCLNMNYMPLRRPTTDRGAGEKVEPSVVAQRIHPKIQYGGRNVLLLDTLKIALFLSGCLENFYLFIPHGIF